MNYKRNVADLIKSNISPADIMRFVHKTSVDLCLSNHSKGVTPAQMLRALWLITTKYALKHVNSVKVGGNNDWSDINSVELRKSKDGVVSLDIHKDHTISSTFLDVKVHPDFSSVDSITDPIPHYVEVNKKYRVFVHYFRLIAQTYLSWCKSKDDVDKTFRWDVLNLLLGDVSDALRFIAPITIGTPYNPTKVTAELKPFIDEQDFFEWRSYAARCQQMLFK